MPDSRYAWKSVNARETDEKTMIILRTMVTSHQWREAHHSHSCSLRNRLPTGRVQFRACTKWDEFIREVIMNANTKRGLFIHWLLQDVSDKQAVHEVDCVKAGSAGGTIYSNSKWRRTMYGAFGPVDPTSSTKPGPRPLKNFTSALASALQYLLLKPTLVCPKSLNSRHEFIVHRSPIPTTAQIWSVKTFHLGTHTHSAIHVMLKVLV